MCCCWTIPFLQIFSSTDDGDHFKYITFFYNKQNKLGDFFCSAIFFVPTPGFDAIIFLPQISLFFAGGAAAAAAAESALVARPQLVKRESTTDVLLKSLLLSELICRRAFIPRGHDQAASRGGSLPRQPGPAPGAGT